MITYLHVRAINQATRRGRISIGGQIFPCWLGRNGTAHRKREGDGKTPIGVYRLGTVHFRPDNVKLRGWCLPTRPLKREMGWCELPRSGQYNRAIKLPFRDASESMWRDDNAYDIVVPTSHNERPRIKGFGSAIFFHLLRDGADSTAGCVAVEAHVMRKILTRCNKRAYLVVWPPLGSFRFFPRK